MDNSEIRFYARRTRKNNSIVFASGRDIKKRGDTIAASKFCDAHPFPLQKYGAQVAVQDESWNNLHTNPNQHFLSNKKAVFYILAFLFFVFSSFASDILPLPKKSKVLTPAEIIIHEPLAILDTAKTKKSRIGINLIGEKIKIEEVSELTDDKFTLILSLYPNYKNNDIVKNFVFTNQIDMLPKKTQSYIINFGKSGKWKNTVMIMGGDKTGLLYGCVSFSQLIKDNKVSRKDIFDYPSYQYRIIASFADLYYKYPHLFHSDKEKFAELCRKRIDNLLKCKVNGIYIGSKMIPKLGQQTLLKFDDSVKKMTQWLRPVVTYGKERGIHFFLYSTVAVAVSKDIKQNPELKSLMCLRYNLFTWSRDDLLTARAENLARLANWIGCDIVTLHYPDTVNENWINRSESDRKRFGDNRAEADAHVASLFLKVFKRINPAFRLCITFHPYSAFYIKDSYYRDYLKNLARILDPSIPPVLRECDRTLWRQMAAIYDRPVFLYYEPHRLLVKGKKRVGLDRPLLSTNPRMLKTFYNGKEGNIIYDIWYLSKLEFMIMNQYVWNINAPGAEDSFKVFYRLTPFDGRGNKAFFEVTLHSMCENLFGEKAASQMIKLFKLNIQTSFLLQPFPIAENTKKFLREWYAGVAPSVNFDSLFSSQLIKLKKADKIVTELASHPEFFKNDISQKEFAKYYKEIKLLSFIAPINFCRWQANRLLAKGEEKAAEKVLKHALELIDIAKQKLPSAIEKVNDFKQYQKGAITRVPCWPGASQTWNMVYLDKYFVKNIKKQIKALKYFSKKSVIKNPLSKKDKDFVKKGCVYAHKVRKNEITLDGDFSEKAWRKADRIPFIRLQKPNEKTLSYPENRGYARILWDKNNIYIALTFEENEIDSLVGTTGERDKSFFSDDIFEIFLLPEGSKMYCHICGNVSGRKWDAVPVDTGFGIQSNLRWNPDWHVKIKIDAVKGEWRAEIQIPFSAFSPKFFGKVVFPYQKNKVVWKVNIGRERRNTEISSIAPCSSFHQKERYFNLIFEKK